MVFQVRSKERALLPSGVVVPTTPVPFTHLLIAPKKLDGQAFWFIYPQTVIPNSKFLKPASPQISKSRWQKERTMVNSQMAAARGEGSSASKRLRLWVDLSGVAAPRSCAPDLLGPLPSAPSQAFTRLGCCNNNRADYQNLKSNSILLDL
jgi:hypothetical protein